MLHVGPHPDDEILGAGGALRSLIDNGWQVHNLACSLGRPADHDRRRNELLRAADKVGFRTTVMNPPAMISSTDDFDLAVDVIAEAVADRIAALAPGIVVSPHPHDGHHGHEVVARGVGKALSEMGSAAPPWWMWGLWADLPIPSLYVPFGQSVMSVLSQALAEYVGENVRTPYDRLQPARAAANAVLGAERVFGFGSSTSGGQPYADLLTEVHRVDDRWILGRPRILDPAVPLEPPGTASLREDVTWWVTQDSATTNRRRRSPKSSAA